MRKLSSLAAISAASILFSSVSAAQTGDNDYDFQWAPMNDAAANFYVSGKGFLGAFTGQGPSFGSAWRKCYSVDITQGGKNQSDSQFESSWFRIYQGWSAQNVLQGVNIGIVSLQAASDSDLGGDACLSPWFASVGNTGGHNIVAAADPGLQAGTAVAPFPSFWDLAFQWNVDPVTGVAGSVTGANAVGVDSTNPFGAPLLANVIFEMQGPSVSGIQDDQYYLITGSEVTGLGTATAFVGRGTGGVTNGNSAWGSTITGVGPDASGLVSHSRWIADTGGGGLTAGSLPVLGSESFEILGHVAFSTPFLWAENNGSIGSGGPDWNIASGTPSTVQVWLKDIQAGAEGTIDVDYKIGGGGANGAAFNPNLILNFSYFLWSTTAANSMAQRPMSWSDAFGAPTPGSVPVVTSREGAQLLPINFDGLTNSLLNLPGLSQGTPFSGADSALFDTLGAGNSSALFEGDFNNTNPYFSGISKLSIAGGSAFPVANAPIPGFGGLNIGIAALGVQVVNAGGAAALKLTEFGNGLTITLQ